MEPSHYFDLDVSQELTSVCVIDQQGIVVWRGKCSTDPDAIAEAIRQHAPRVVRAGLETGLLSNFLTRALRARGVPIVCLDAPRQGRSSCADQQDRCQRRARLGAGGADRLVPRDCGQEYGCAVVATLVGCSRATGIAAPGNCQYTARPVEGVWPRGPQGRWRAVRRPCATGLRRKPGPLRHRRTNAGLSGRACVLDGQLLKRAKSDPATQRLMSIPAVGVIVALACGDRLPRTVQTIQHGRRLFGLDRTPLPIRRCRLRGAHLQMRRWASAHLSVPGGECYLTRKVTDSTLRRWGHALVARIGLRRPTVAVARKLAVIMHAVWKNDRDFDCDGLPAHA
jgi:transposase